MPPQTPSVAASPTPSPTTSSAPSSTASPETTAMCICQGMIQNTFHNKKDSMWYGDTKLGSWFVLPTDPKNSSPACVQVCMWFSL